MTEPLIFEVPGEPDTNHRRWVVGKRRSIVPPEHRAWKERVTWCGRQALRVWVKANGTWRQDRAYAVSVVLYSAKRRHPDADNGRGALDALQGVLWRSDQRCHPVVYDVQRSDRPRLEVSVTPYDPKRQRVEAVLRVVDMDCEGADRG